MNVYVYGEKSILCGSYAHCTALLKKQLIRPGKDKTNSLIFVKMPKQG